MDGSTRGSFTRKPQGAQQRHTQFTRNRWRRRSAPPYLPGAKSAVTSFSIAAHWVRSLAFAARPPTAAGSLSTRHPDRTARHVDCRTPLVPTTDAPKPNAFALSHAFSAVDRFSEAETGQVSMSSLRRTTFPVALRGSGSEVIRHREGTLYFARRALTNVCSSASATDTGASTTTIAATSSP